VDFSILEKIFLRIWRKDGIEYVLVVTSKNRSTKERGVAAALAAQ